VFNQSATISQGCTWWTRQQFYWVFYQMQHWMEI